MLMRSLIKYFKDGNVLVTGLRGRGKDMLMANVIARRAKPYISNVDYKCKDKRCIWFKYNPLEFDTHNTYKNFIDGNVVPYRFNYPDGTDIYISDAGVYFPSQYCNELNKLYGGFVSFMALSRHLGAMNVHTNSQNINRVYDKIREQADGYIYCNKCIVLPFGFVLQLITIYEKYESCANRVPPFCLSKPIFNKDRQQQWEIQFTNYRITHGKVERKILFYRNKTQYDTRIFKTMLDPGNKDKEELRESLRVQLRAELIDELKKGSADDEKTSN